MAVRALVEPGAAPPVYLKLVEQRCCVPSKILCWYFNVLTIMKFVGVR